MANTTDYGGGFYPSTPFLDQERTLKESIKELELMQQNMSDPDLMPNMIKVTRGINNTVTIKKMSPTTTQGY